MNAPNKKALINPQLLLNVDDAGFRIAAITLFNYQYENNDIYRQYCDALRVDPAQVTDLSSIPFLPVSFFNTHTVVTAPATPGNCPVVFESSGTTGGQTSRHFVMDSAIYEESLLNGFEQFYRPAKEYAILALLPSYLERKNASLVYMAKTLMNVGKHPANGFYIDEWQKLSETLKSLEQKGTKTLLLGVTFALLDFAAAFPMPLRHTVVMETGGMKGRRAELTRGEVHEILKTQFGMPHIHSEYGMTELLSQAYAVEAGKFKCTATMKVLVRDTNDPLDISSAGTGALNIIDLANVYSCAFVATDDIGTLQPDGTFEVLGRLDHSALRGCSLMAV